MSQFAKEKDFVASLSPEQAAAATELENPVLLVAGAGSGKTRTLIGRATNILLPKKEGGVGANPGTLMMVTFTNKAAGEMRERFSPIMKGLAAANVYGDPWVGTFHSISMRILREEADHANLSKNFSIIDDSDSREIARDAMKAAGMEGMDIDAFFSGLEFVKARLYQPKLLLARKMEMARNANIPNFLPNPVQKEWARIIDKVLPPGFEVVYENYQRILTESNAVDFSDLINSVTFLLRSNPGIRDSWRSRFRHFMIDESQDMNPAQAAWLAELTGKGAPTDFDPTGLEENAFGEAISTQHGHTVILENLRDFPKPSIMFVGDPRQSIYAFRGSDPRMMEGLPESYHNLKVMELVESYRCSGNVLSSANRLIRKNGERFGSGMKSADPDRVGVPVEVRAMKDWKDEFSFIADKISDSIKAGKKPSDIGVLVRTRAAAKEIASFLRESGIHVTEGKASDIRKSVEYKDIISYANFLINPQGEVFLRRIINKPARGMGKDSLNAVILNAKLKGIGFSEELRTIMNGKIDIPEEGKIYSEAFKRSTKDFGLMIVKMRNQIINMSATDALDHIMRKTTYLEKIMNDAMGPLKFTDEIREEMLQLPLREFVNRIIETQKLTRRAVGGDEKASDIPLEDAVDRIGGISEAMRRIGNIMMLMDQAKDAPTLVSFLQESALELSKENEAPGVSVVTMHASKGREFDDVYMPLMYSGMMPHFNSTEGEALREERRLAYVGMTRAINNLFVTFPQNIFGAKFSYGANGLVGPSPFLDELATAEPDTVRYDARGNLIDAGRGFSTGMSDSGPRQQAAEEPRGKPKNAWVFSKNSTMKKAPAAEGPGF